jgi:hypothetical protein
MSLALLLFRGGGGNVPVVVSLNGTGSTVSSENLTPSVNNTLTGIPYKQSQGVIATGVIALLTGAQQASNSGLLNASNVPSLSGQSENTQSGAVTPSIATVIQLTGISQSQSVGILLPTVATGFNGIQQQLTNSNLAASLTAGLTGNGLNGNLGALQTSSSPNITGNVEALQIGSLSPSNAVVIQLTGAQSNSSAGNLSGSISNSITGNDLTESAGIINPQSQSNQITVGGWLKYFKELEDERKKELKKREEEELKQAVQSLDSDIVDIPLQESVRRVKRVLKNTNYLEKPVNISAIDIAFEIQRVKRQVIKRRNDEFMMFI